MKQARRDSRYEVMLGSVRTTVAGCEPVLSGLEAGRYLGQSWVGNWRIEDAVATAELSSSNRVELGRSRCVRGIYIRDFCIRPLEEPRVVTTEAQRTRSWRGGDES